MKSGVKLAELTPQVVLALVIADELWRDRGSDLRITSANDGIHPGGLRPSFHPKGQAVDLGIKDIPEGNRMALITALADRLGAEFDVLWEHRGTDNEHIHLQWDP